MAKTRKPTSLHLVEGTLHPTKHKARTSEPVPSGNLRRPGWLKARALKQLAKELAAMSADHAGYRELVERIAIDRRAAQIWTEDSKIAFWLTAADSRAFGTWCRMSAQLERADPDPAWRAQWRMLGSELGFFAASRSKLNMKEADGDKQNPGAKFYA